MIRIAQHSFLACLFLAFAAPALLPLAGASAGGNDGNHIRLTQDWEFFQGDLGGVWEGLRAADVSDISLWQTVTLPHCFNARDAVDPDVSYYQGPGWYRTQLTLDNPFPEGRTLLLFEGAGQKTRVYVGDQLVADHVGGYDEFQVDITEAAEAVRLPDGSVPLLIRCDNSRDLEAIPSDLSDFNLYGRALPLRPSDLRPRGLARRSAHRHEGRSAVGCC